jgi:TolB-like protein/Tfp pilus assembly protein PilF
LVRVGLALAGVVIVAAVAGLASMQLGRRGSAGADSLTSVAVLPFRIIGDTAQAAIADGLTEGVITGLVRVEGLRVPAPSRVLAYRDLLADPREIGRALDVAAVVSATVQQAGGTLRVTAELINVGDGLVRWRERFDGELLVNGQLQDIFTIQDEITARIVDALQVRLTRASREALARGVRTRDREAYNLYLQARRATYELTLPGVERSITLLERALVRDSGFADAWVALADAYAFHSQFGGLPMAEVAVRWRRAVERGIELDSLNGFAFALRGVLRSQYDWDWDGALLDLRRAVRLSPASAEVELNYAAFLNLLDEPESALVHMRQAVSLDPTNSFLRANLAWRMALAGMRDSAIAVSELTLGLDSTQWVASYLLTKLYSAVGQRAEAEREAERMLRLAGPSPVALAWAAQYYGLTGQRERARGMLARLVALARRQYVQATYIASARLATGDRAGALDALEESARNRDLDLVWDLFASFQALEGDARFEAVRRRVYGDRPSPRGWPR